MKFSPDQLSKKNLLASFKVAVLSEQRAALLCEAYPYITSRLTGIHQYKYIKLYWKTDVSSEHKHLSKKVYSMRFIQIIKYD